MIWTFLKELWKIGLLWLTIICCSIFFPLSIRPWVGQLQPGYLHPVSLEPFEASVVQLRSHPDVQWHNFIVSGPAIFQGMPPFWSPQKNSMTLTALGFLSCLLAQSLLPSTTTKYWPDHQSSVCIAVGHHQSGQTPALVSICLPVELKTLLPYGYLSPARHPHHYICHHYYSKKQWFCLKGM